MHVAVLGPGALGCVYAARLALRTHADVTLVGRRPHVGRPEIVLEQAHGERLREVWAEPRRATSVPASADVVLVCVRVEQLDGALLEALAAAPERPIVFLTPLLPADYERVRRALGERAIAGMPGVVAYVAEGTSARREGEHVVRYWVPAVAPTLLDEPRVPMPALVALAEALGAAGLPTRIELGVHEANPATTVTFLPLVFALDIAGGVDALLADRALVALALAGVREGVELATRIGKPALWAGLFRRFLGPRWLRVGVSLARRASPEAMAYVDLHFAQKLRLQNRALATAMVELAEAKQTPHAALLELRSRLAQGDGKG